MHYFIDGYNLMFRTVRAGDDLQAQRNQIIENLNAKVAAVQLDVTIVFDAQYQAGEGSRAHLRALEILFTRQGQTADQYIIDALRASAYPQEHTVVTSDKKLAWYARRKMAKTETVEEFMQALNRRFRNKLRSTPAKVMDEPKPEPKKAPKKQDSVEACADYYLEVFEKRAAEEMQKNAPVEKPEKKKVRQSKKPPVANTEEDDMVRWLRLFQRKPDDEHTF